MKNIKYIITILSILVSISFYAQDKNVKTIHKRYISLKNWKKTHDQPLTKSDSLNFKYIENDTLVLVEAIVRPPGRTVPYEYKDSTFLDYYSKVAFRLDQDSLDQKEVMKYWKKPIKIFFGESVSNKEIKEFKSFATSTIELIDSLQVTFVNKLEDSNYIIYYDKDYNYESKMNLKKWSEFYMHWRGGQIKSFAMRINTEYYFSEKLRLMEMKRYFIESLGYFRTLNDFPCESYFSKCHSKEKQLTTLDIELLKYHYSYGICKGTTYDVFMDQHKRAKEILKKGPNYNMNFFHQFETNN